jgi:hypothetical protein
VLDEIAFSQDKPFIEFCNGLNQFEGPERDFIQGISILRFLDPLIAPPEQPRFSGRHPLYVRITVIPFRDTTPSFQQRIDDYANQQPFPTIVLQRLPAQLLAAVGGGGIVFTGTLGGMLECGNSGTHYGLTCSHVAQTRHANVALTDVGGSSVVNAGTVAETNYANLSARAHPAGTLCNPVSTPAPIREVDAAMITLNTGHTAANSLRSLAPIKGIYKLAALSAGDTVEMLSGATGHVSYRIAGLTVTCKLSMQGTDYCFANLLQTYSPPTAPTPLWLARAFTSPPKAGDSGAWMCRAVPDPNDPSKTDYFFAGMLIGGNGSDGFSHFTDEILSWAAGLNPARALQTF